ncbi:MAG: glycosyltransferase family 4 protein [Clostridia bacterium]|nr:glycosyltransferase family 4 protein [Clostridia bacterium]
MSRKIRVMHIISDMNFGGAGQYLRSIVDQLDRKSFEVAVVIPRGSILRQYIIEKNIIEVDSIADKSFGVGGTMSLVKPIKTFRPDVVHTHASLSGRLAAQMLGVKSIVYTKHTLSDHSNAVKNNVRLFLNKRLRAKVIAISSAVEANLLEEGIQKENIVKIYNGVKPAYKVKTVHNEIPVITLVGRLEPIKGQMHMIEIVKALTVMTDRPFKVRFVGAGSMEAQLKEAARRANLQIEFTGHVEDIDSVYVNSDIIVNTSNSEALSYAAIEGMNMKKPVVAFDLPGINEVIDHEKSGYLVAFGDYGTFAERLLELIEHSELRNQMGENGFKKILEVFTLEKMVKKIEAFYKEEGI